MKEDMLFQIFTEETKGNNYEKGQRVLNNDLVSSINIKSIEEIIHVDGNVISENLFNEYHTNIKIQTGKVGILSTYCSCLDFEQSGVKKKNYACKHIVASFYKAAEELANHPLLNVEIRGTDNNKSNILSMLLGDEKDKDEIKIEVYLNRDSWSQSISAEFKIGLKTMGFTSLYVLKDINQFLQGYFNDITVEYGKNFIFNMKSQRLNIKDRRLVDFIETLREMDGKNRFINKNAEKYIDGKCINIPSFQVREFCEIICKHRVYFNEGFFSRPVAAEISFKEPEIDFDLKQMNGNYILRSPGGMPIALSSRNDVFLYGTTLYLPDYEFCYSIDPFLQMFNQSKTITISGTEEDTLLRRLIPKLHLLSSNVILSKSIMDKIVIADAKFNFYFDRQGKDVSLELKAKYGAYEFNIFEDVKEKVIYRDSRREQQILSILRNIGFEEVEGRFYLIKEDDYVFRFFKNDLQRLHEIGEVYYSENFKGIKSVGNRGIKGDIRSGKYN